MIVLGWLGIQGFPGSLRKSLQPRKVQLWTTAFLRLVAHVLGCLHTGIPGRRRTAVRTARSQMRALDRPTSQAAMRHTIPVSRTGDPAPRRPA